MQLEHFLISIPLNAGQWAHYYLMCPHGTDRKNAYNDMLNILEENGVTLRTPVILDTKLDEPTVKRVREIASAADPLIAAALEGATTFHRSMWVTDDQKINDELEAIH